MPVCRRAGLRGRCNANYRGGKMLKISAYITLIWLALAVCRYAAAKEEDTCFADEHPALQTVIPCYNQQLATLPLSFSLKSVESGQHAEIRHYRLMSQSWSPQDAIRPTQWWHDVDIYIPNGAFTGKALLVMSEDCACSAAGPGTSGNQKPAFSAEALAAQSKTVVVVVNRLPYPYLEYQNEGRRRSGAESRARGWRLFLDDADEYLMMPLHIPMTAALSQTMTLAQRELRQWGIDKFIVAGVSEGGTTALLTALSDERIDAVAAIFPEGIAARQVMKHTYRTYGGRWPLAFHPYYQLGIDRRIETPAFDKLMQIEDPIEYPPLAERGRPPAPKYFIVAGGDERYPPDSTRFYLNKLPGEVSMRAIAGDERTVPERGVLALVNRRQRDIALPTIEVQSNASETALRTLRFSEPPIRVLRWTAHNRTARDFRYSCGVRYTSAPLEANRGEFRLNAPAQGWEATFIEAEFSDGYIATSPVFITPDDRYPIVAPAGDGLACETLPGRGLGEDYRHDD